MGDFASRSIDFPLLVTGDHSVCFAGKALHCCQLVTGQLLMDIFEGV